MVARRTDQGEHLSVLGSRLRQLREGLGLVLQDVADLFETNRNVPSQWETGQRVPSYSHLLRLADFYGVTVDWLLGRQGAERDSPRVKQMKSQLLDYLRLQEVSARSMTPGERLALTIGYLTRLDMDMFSTNRIAQQVLISPETLNEMIRGRIMATGPVIQRFAQLANLPEVWFYQPEPQLEDVAVKYRSLLERFLAEGLSPDELEHRLWGPGRSRRSRGSSRT